MVPSCGDTVFTAPFFMDAHAEMGSMPVHYSNSQYEVFRQRVNSIETSETAHKKEPMTAATTAELGREVRLTAWFGMRYSVLRNSIR